MSSWKVIPKAPRVLQVLYYIVHAAISPLYLWYLFVYARLPHWTVNYLESGKDVLSALCP